MKDFWIVCGWDQYYPLGGIRNILFVSFNEDEARNVIKKYQQSGSADFYTLFHSSELPWSKA